MLPNQRVAVVTGANKGIGYFVALQLGLSGLFSDIILGCRDVNRGATAMQNIQYEINQRTNDVRVHSLQLEIGNMQSQTEFCRRIDREFNGSIDVLVNNAGFAYKGADPTPFEGQTAKTFQTNYYGLVNFTEHNMLPLLRKGTDARIVNVASMAGRLRQVSPQLQARFTDPQLTIPELNQLMNTFEQDVQRGVHRQNGWSNSNYGMSKLGVIAATRVWARQFPDISITSCCPGYCDTDMTSGRGRRHPSKGAQNAVIPATMPNPPSGVHFSDYEVSIW